MLMNIGGPDYSQLDQVVEEFTGQCRRGEASTIEDYATRYPALAEEIHDLFPTIETMERLKREKENGTIQPEPTVLGDFRILHEIGRGGMGIVYEAEQMSLHRRVALKLLPQHSQLDPMRRERFDREARAVARLHHSNIVEIYGVGNDGDSHFYVMKLIEGPTLREVLEVLKGKGSPPENHSEPPPISPLFQSTPGDSTYWNDIAELGVQVAGALHYAHGRGILHRDIKPANLLLDEEGTVHVTDFGLAKIIDQPELTATTDVLGSLSYLAPESLEMKSDPRSDIYSLGMTLYELLTLKTPFEGVEPATLLREIAERNLPAPRTLNPAIPRDLDTIISKAMACDPRHRYNTADDFGRDLQRFLEDRPIHARRTGPVERLWRWSRRNRTVAALSGAALTLLIIAVVTGWLGYVNTSRALVAESEKKLEAEVATKRADANVQLSLEALADIFNGLEARNQAQDFRFGQGGLSTSRPDGPGSGGTVLASILGFYEKFAEMNPTDPRLKMEAAKAYSLTAGIHQQFGMVAENSRAAIRKSATLAEEIARDAMVDPEIRNELIRLHVINAKIIAAAGNITERDRFFQQALEIGAELVEKYPDEPRYRDTLAKAHLEFASLLPARENFVAAKEHFLKAIALQEIPSNSSEAANEEILTLAVSRGLLAKLYLEDEQSAKAKEIISHSIADLEDFLQLLINSSSPSRNLLMRTRTLNATHFATLADALEVLAEPEAAKVARRRAEFFRKPPSSRRSPTRRRPPGPTPYP